MSRRRESVSCLGGSASRAGLVLALAILVASSVAQGTASASLPDGRGYEQVTPVDKDFGFGTFGSDVGLSSSAGGASVYNAFGPLPGSDSGSAQNYYLGARSVGGWSFKAITPLHTPIPGAPTYPRTQAFSPDLSKQAVVSANPPLTPDATPDVGNLYIRDTSSGSYRLITTAPGTPGYSPFLSFGGASLDFSHVVFEGSDPLTPDAVSSDQTPGLTNNAYESVGGQLRLVGILPDGSVPDPGSFLGAGAQLGRRLAHAVSDDGSRIFFGAANSDFGSSLYVREDGTKTVEVSASKADTPDPNPPQDTTFWSASADGSKVFFTSAAELTNDANTGKDGSGNATDAGHDLYEYDVDTDRLTDLSVGTNPADSATGADVQGVVGASDDGSYVYFVAHGDLGGGATSGAPNLYVWHGGATTFIATLDPADSPNWGVITVGTLTSRVTPDGRHVLLQSTRSLTGYDNTDALTGNADSEAFLYDADSSELRCVSCNPSGARPLGPSTLRPPIMPTNFPRTLADDGGRVFFDSSDALVSRDTNGRQDVYEFERDGHGSCRASGGCLHLISSGTSRFDSSFQDASVSGDDVLFSTREQLLAQDGDDLVDLYDARVGGGFSPPSPRQSCAVGDCQGQLSSPPGAALPGSAFFTGPGNAEAKRGASFSIGAISKAAQRRLANTGRLTLSARVSKAGRLSARATARIGRHTVTVAKRSASAHSAGTTRLVIVLSRSARRQLARRHRLTVRISVSYSAVRGAKHATLTLHR